MECLGGAWNALAVHVQRMCSAAGTKIRSRIWPHFAFYCFKFKAVKATNFGKEIIKCSALRSIT
jgi:hypothetical protein